ncbi:hypothetical protein WFJ72_13025 [Yersinia enterocolitica]
MNNIEELREHCEEIMAISPLRYAYIPASSIITLIDRIEKAEAELSAVQLDATRWRAMLSSPAIRILGYAGLQDDKPIDGHYCHFGMEIWSHHEPYYDNKRAGILITRYADNMIAASLVEGNADDNS